MQARTGWCKAFRILKTLFLEDLNYYCYYWQLPSCQVLSSAWQCLRATLVSLLLGSSFPPWLLTHPCELMSKTSERTRVPRPLVSVWFTREGVRMSEARTRRMMLPSPARTLMGPRVVDFFRFLLPSLSRCHFIRISSRCEQFAVVPNFESPCESVN